MKLSITHISNRSDFGAEFDIQPEEASSPRATSSRNGGRDHSGMVGDIERNQQPKSWRSPMRAAMRFVLLPGQRFETVDVPPLIEGLAFDALIADKAFDSNTIIAELDARGAKIVISQNPRRAKPLAIDQEMYKWRHLIENFFGRLKEFKRIAMRAEKTDQSFASMIHIAAAVIDSR
ncbi:transposase [Bradyrhizobium niftali]|uniref:transposase n=1 Tax=Bradyrhizobium niftali TaxID=2560055 RepID=UPI003833022B